MPKNANKKTKYIPIEAIPQYCFENMGRPITPETVAAAIKNNYLVLTTMAGGKKCVSSRSLKNWLCFKIPVRR